MRKKITLFIIIVSTLCLFSFREQGFSATKRFTKKTAKLVNEISYIPLKIFTQKYGFELIFNNESKVASLSSEDVTVILRVKSDIVMVNDTVMNLLGPVIILAGELLIPHHFTVIEFPKIKKRIQHLKQRKKFLFYQKKEDFIVVLDPGHGGNDPGAVSPDGTLEKDINLDVGLRVSRRLTDKGIILILTRDKDQFVSLPRRVALAKKHGADLFVSIHANAAHRNGASGIEIFYPSQREHISKKALLNGVYFAEQVDKQFQERLGIRSRGIKPADYHVLRNACYPALLIEIGFLTNEEDLSMLKKHSAREVIADVLADEILQYYRSVRQSSAIGKD